MRSAAPAPTAPLPRYLTHLASRATIGALTLPNTKGYLGGWILDPQHAKPGNKMPGFDLPGPELQSLLEYLTSLR